MKYGFGKFKNVSTEVKAHKSQADCFVYATKYGFMWLETESFIKFQIILWN